MSVQTGFITFICSRSTSRFRRWRSSTGSGGNQTTRDHSSITPGPAGTTADLSSASTLPPHREDPLIAPGLHARSCESDPCEPQRRLEQRGSLGRVAVRGAGTARLKVNEEQHALD